MNDDSHEQDAEPGHYAADDLGIGGTEGPAQIVAGKIAKNTDHFQAEDPTRVQADGKI